MKKRRKAKAVVARPAPQPCSLCGEPHDTICESCARVICYGCDANYEDAPVCVECHAQLREEEDRPKPRVRMTPSGPVLERAVYRKRRVRIVPVRTRR